MLRKLTLLVSLLALVTFTSACKGGGGGSPVSPSGFVSPNTPQNATSGGEVASTAGLSPDVKAYLRSAMWTMQDTVVQRMASRTTPVRVYPGPYSAELVLRAANIWAPDTGLTFTIVATEAESEISVANVVVPVGCGNAQPFGVLPLITGGKVKVSFGLKAGCSDQGNTILGSISHEIGHILGFGHSADETDVMSPASWTLDLSSVTSPAVRWTYRQEVGAVIQW